MLFNKTVSLIIPCKNEQTSLPRLLKKAPDFIDEILVIDNNSTDRTAAVATKLGVKVIFETQEINGIGYGFAHQAGLKKAQGDYIVAMDGDNGYPIEVIGEIINKMNQENIDFISCSRFPLSSRLDMSPIRQFGGQFLTQVFNILFNQNMSDILTGMWILKRNSLSFLDLKEGDWNFSINIKASALLSPKIKFAEHHISYHDRSQGTSKQSLIKTGLNHFQYLLHLRIGYKSAFRHSQSLSISSSAE